MTAFVTYQRSKDVDNMSYSRLCFKPLKCKVKKYYTILFYIKVMKKTGKKNVKSKNK